ncbi:MAG TPA: DUF4870 domain-containing protein [Pirellulales bacterium]|jgi:hypothetical protein|nr:DUF4870 domain-containing protein [Pirellulales bacterium]
MSDTIPPTDAIPPPPVAEPDKYVRQWAMLCHLSALAMFLGPTLANIAGPLIVWVLKREEHPFIDEQGKESLNFQISMSLYTWVLGAVMAATCVGLVFLPLLVIIPVADVILVVIASLKVSNGMPFQYPLTIRFLK